MSLAETFATSGQTFQLSEQDWDFIKTISYRFPERQPSIYKRFRYMNSVTPKHRPSDALLLLKQLPRQGLLQRSYPHVKSVYKHERDLSRILGKLFRASAELRFKYHGNHARKILVHDMGEALTTDFTPLDIELGKITKEEKHHLENLAVKLIFAEDPVRLKAFLDYEAKNDLEDYVIKAVDYLEWWGDALRINPHTDLINELIGNARDVKMPIKQILRDMAPVYFELNTSPQSEYVGKRIIRALNAD